MVAEGGCCSLVGDLSAVCRAFFGHVAPAHDIEFALYACFDQWALGGDGLCPGGGDFACGGRRTRWASSGAACFARYDACGVCDDSGMFGDAVARGKIWAARCAGLFLCPDDGVHRADVWQSVLSWTLGASVVFCLFVFFGFGRRKFRGLFALAAGAISDGVPC